LGADHYQSEQAPKDYGEGKWEATPTRVRQWLRVAFGKNGLIDSLEHPEIQKLWGKI
jgi:hypothetical protein